MTIELAAALYRLRRLPPERLGDLGVTLIERGIDTPAVRELAFLDRRTTWSDVGNVFERVLAETGQQALSEEEAAYLVAEAAAADIVAGAVTPYEGAARIAYQAWHASGMADELTPFYFWADEWEDHPEYREACEQDIRREAAEFLGRRRAQST